MKSPGRAVLLTVFGVALIGIVFAGLAFTGALPLPTLAEQGEGGGRHDAEAGGAGPDTYPGDAGHESDPGHSEQSPGTSANPSGVRNLVLETGGVESRAAVTLATGTDDFNLPGALEAS